MTNFHGKTLSWTFQDGVLELALHREPCNEIGISTLEELERFVQELPCSGEAAVIIIHSTLASGFSAGADLRETYRLTQGVPEKDKMAGVRDFITRIHAVFNTLDASPLVTIAAVHGICFGGGFELALTCDLIIADRMARFCFPELRLGLIPGFGGIPRLQRDLGNAGSARLRPRARPCVWHAAPRRRSRNSIRRLGRRRRSLSNRFPSRPCAGRSKSFAICLLSRRSRRACASLWKARRRCLICRKVQWICLQ
jgi:hypothetical protein